MDDPNGRPPHSTSQPAALSKLVDDMNEHRGERNGRQQVAIRECEHACEVQRGETTLEGAQGRVGVREGRRRPLHQLGQL